MGRYFVVGGNNGTVRYDVEQELTAAEKKQAQENIGIDVSTGLVREIVDKLPTTGIKSNVIYMVPNGKSGNNVYDEYMYINNAWEKIGSSDVDLSGYYTKSEVDTKVDAKADQDTTYTKNEVDGKVTTINQEIAKKADASNVYTKSEVYNKTEANGYFEQAAEADINILNYAKGHAEDTTIHVTADDKSNWNGKTTMSEVEGKGYTTMTAVEQKGYTTMSAVEAKGYATTSQVDAKADKSDVYQKSEVYTKSEVDTKIGDINNILSKI